MLTYILFAIGFVLLIKGAQWLVSGASAIARRFGLTDFVIGLTIVSLGTSMPELTVNLMASVSGSAGLAIGNVLGSNIANVLLILGATAVIANLPIHRNTVLSEIPFSLAAALLVGFLANADVFGAPKPELLLDRLDGGIILFFFGLFMVYIAGLPREEAEETGRKPAASLTRDVLLTAAGIIGLFLGGKWVVEGAIQLARLFGMSETFIGLTVVAVGTSLPELVTSMLAARKGSTDIAVGNVIGSNIFNLLLILGISSLVRPLAFDLASNIDLLVILFSSSLLILFLAIGRKLVIGRWEGVILLLLYGGYLYFLVGRG